MKRHEINKPSLFVFSCFFFAGLVASNFPVLSCYKIDYVIRYCATGRGTPVMVFFKIYLFISPCLYNLFTCVVRIHFKVSRIGRVLKLRVNTTNDCTHLRSSPVDLNHRRLKGCSCSGGKEVLRILTD